MATAEEIAQVRDNTKEPVATSTYTDPQIEAIIDEAGSVDAASAIIWRRKARDLMDLVDISEAGSSRKNGVLYDRAVQQAQYFEQASGTEPTDPGSTSTTRRIVRL